MQNEILEKLAAIPGVKSAGFVSEMPMEGFDSDWDTIFAEGKTYPDNVIAPLHFYKYVSPGFFADGWYATDRRPRIDVG